MVAKAEASEAAARRARTAWPVWSVLGLATAMALAVAFSARVTGPLRLFAEAAGEIGAAGGVAQVHAAVVRDGRPVLPQD